MGDRGGVKLRYIPAITMISAVCWVPKGASKTVPEVAEPPSQEEIDQIIATGALERRGDSEGEEDEDMDIDASHEVDEVSIARAAARALGKGNTSSANFQDITDGLQELDMDNYDEEDDGIELFSTGLGDVFYPSNHMDPYLKNKDDDDDDDEESEGNTIKPTDAVIICARNDDELSHLEVYIFEELEDGDSNMYVHHDIILPAFPLCTAWLDCNLKSGDKVLYLVLTLAGNFIAVGSMEPAIEIWDLDLIDEVKPFMELGGVSKRKKEGRKVQAVTWSLHSPEVLLSGSFDKSVIMMDMSSSEHARNKWSVAADVESLAWDPHNEHLFVVSLENGTVQGFDIRVTASDSSSGPKPCFTLHAHDKAVSSISYNPSIPNLLATASTDKMVKLWDISNNQPSCVASTNPKAVWNTLSDPGVVRSFGRYRNQKNRSDASS
ncbi:putative WD repeat-containing protein C17D11.16 [Cocos nucifera]|uniref:Putative WD repeat-containing protein C17D11.16 n=1 Tax=Cocos nucifera TaxID=13894 RepID=A0A8K0N236_COCNU|nr:putative WD repeat-containing protein C17D11.16 [Cocos nucifera]